VHFKPNDGAGKYQSGARGNALGESNRCCRVRFQRRNSGAHARNTHDPGR
jgi:hypothetical protein